MSILLADIDATCAALGYNDGIKYQADPDAIQGLKVSVDRRLYQEFAFNNKKGRVK